MATLDNWLHLLGATPRTLIFPSMTLISGHDWEPPILEGKGEVALLSPNSFEFRITGRPASRIDTFHRIKRAHDNPYDTFEQFRLLGVDDAGVEWAMGWTTPILTDIAEETWTMSGSIHALSTDVRCFATGQPSVENIVELPIQHPMVPVIGGFTSSGKESADRQRQHRIEALGTVISFSFRPEMRALSICASTTESLNHPYAENWLAEPFRIIFGQSIYPRLVARNFGDGRAMVSFRRSPGLIRNASYAALWAADAINKTKDCFWALYAQLLTFIALAQDGTGAPIFQENPLTQFYEEIAQASRGTRWVRALTLASTIEGQANMLSPPGTRHPHPDMEAIGSLSEHIRTWCGAVGLRDRAINAVKRTEFVTATDVLRKLRDQAVLSKDELDSWQSIRNEVMHGTLMSPWSQQEEDVKLENLASLFHKMTMQILRVTEGSSSASGLAGSHCSNTGA